MINQVVNSQVVNSLGTDENPDRPAETAPPLKVGKYADAILKPWGQQTSRPHTGAAHQRTRV